MSNYLVFALLGMGSGATLGMLALGVLLGYRGSGVVNFSHGAIAMYVAYVWYELRANGVYMIPVPGLPAGIPLGEIGSSVAGALVLSLATAALLGLALHLLVLRPLRNAPMLARVVSTIGFMLLLQSLVAFRFGTTSVAVPKLLPEMGSVPVLGAFISWEMIIMAVLCVVIAIGLTLFFKYTRFGIATRAASENEKAATLLGFSPDFQAGVNWVLASVLAGISGILIAPLLPMSPTSFSLLIVPALAAALLARFTSFMIAAFAAIGIGMLQGLVTELPNQLEWFPKSGAAESLPFIIIIIVIFLTGKSLPTRGMLLEARLPAAPSPATRHIVFGGVFFTLVALSFFVMPMGLRVATVNSIIAATICLSFVVLTGFVGQISLFQLTLSGASAYMLAHLTTSMGVPFVLAVLIAAVFGSLVGVLAAMPALRVRGVSLAIITLAAGYAIDAFFFKNPAYTGGSAGAVVASPELFGINLSFVQGSTIATPQFGIFAIVVLALASFAVANLRRRPSGLRMLALRSNERAAASVGVDVPATKFLAFGLSGFIAGLAGCLMAYQQTFVSGPFDPLASIGFLAIAYVGGLTTISGALVGGSLMASGGVAFYVYSTYVSQENAVVVFSMIAGIGLILTAILNPEGISGAFRGGYKGLVARIRQPGRKEAGPAESGSASDEISDSQGLVGSVGQK